MTVQTPWGYAVEEMPPMITVDEFRALCPGMASTDEQVAAALDAVSSVIRDWCGWHISPKLECTFVGTGSGDLLMLPAYGVTEVSSLEVSGVAIPDFEWTDAGMVRICGRFPDRWRSVRCVYTAGIPSASLGQVVAQIASNSLAAAPGVSSERAGNVSITYNATGSGITGGVSLLPRDFFLLAPYRLTRAW